MKKILVLGAGLVSRPGVHYLLNQPDLEVTVASRTVSKAEELVKGFPNGKAKQVNVEDQSALAELIKENDIVISLLPWIHHMKVANLCVEFAKHMVTTSYVSQAMREFDSKVREKGLLFLNEIGVDPGIDHMSAMKIIDEVENEGGKVLHFYSYCGGLPAPQHNDNPFGYKFSWSPRGVVLASRNPARFLENGKIVEIEGKDLFRNYIVEEVDGLGKFEVYPNRDSVPYKELYGLKDALTVKRGTYRNLGWCDTFYVLNQLGFIDETPRDFVKGNTYKYITSKVLGTSSDADLKVVIKEKIDIEKIDDVLYRLEWLGLFGEEVVENTDNLLDMLSNRLQEKLVYKPGEVDMLLMKHTFIIENKDGSKDRINSTLIDYGIPYGDTSMARTVSLPMAIAVKMIANGQINEIGVRIPNTKDIYEPVMKELEKLNIKMVEKREKLS